MGAAAAAGTSPAGPSNAAVPSIADPVVTNGVHDGVQSKFSFEIPTSCSGVGFTSGACVTSSVRVAVLAVAPATEHMCQEYEHFAVCWAGYGARSRTGRQRKSGRSVKEILIGDQAQKMPHYRWHPLQRLWRPQAALDCGTKVALPRRCTQGGKRSQRRHS